MALQLDRVSVNPGWVAAAKARIRESTLWAQLRKGRARFRRNRFEFSIAIYEGESPVDLHPRAGLRNPVLTRHDVTDRKALFVADPFMLPVDGTWYMFFEVMNDPDDFGEIALATSPDVVHWRYEGVVLSSRFHLSYPHVFTCDGVFYMLPESYQAGAAVLYRADEFPRRWSPVGRLVEGPVLLDSTVFRHEGRWWMFSETNPRHTQDCLRLFHSADLLGPWTEHPQSPIVTGDPSRSRPAGKVLHSGGHPIRFAQSCVPEYGTAVRAFDILELTPSRYRERERAADPILGPGRQRWNRYGMHHIDAHELSPGRWIACVDGR